MPSMRRGLVLVTAVAVALLAGCGDKTPMTDADVGSVTRWAAAYKPIAADMVAASEALNHNQLDAAPNARAGG